MNRKVASFYDKKGNLYVDCTECERGINGKDIDSCSAGWKRKKAGRGCFIGTIIKEIDLTERTEVKGDKIIHQGGD